VPKKRENYADRRARRRWKIEKEKKRSVAKDSVQEHIKYSQIDSNLSKPYRRSLSYLCLFDIDHEEAEIRLSKSDAS
jgi:hypothetical protein